MHDATGNFGGTCINLHHPSLKDQSFTKIILTGKENDLLLELGKTTL